MLTFEYSLIPSTDMSCGSNVLFQTNIVKVWLRLHSITAFFSLEKTTFVTIDILKRSCMSNNLDLHLIEMSGTQGISVMWCRRLKTKRSP